MPLTHPRQFIFTLLCVLFSAGLQAATEYLLGPGDTVKVTVYEHPDLSALSRVAGSGAVTIPLLGEVLVGGLTTHAAELQIAEALKARQLVNRPQVTVAIEEYGSQWVSILGEVKKAGKYPVDGQASVVEMLALAGGLNTDAGDTLTVIKHGAQKDNRYQIDLLDLFTSGDMSKNIGLSSGDIIFVPRMKVFYIYGQVQHPGSYRLDKDMTVMQALSVGGGLTVRGTEKGVKIKRRDHNGKTQTLDAKLDDQLQENDVVYVAESMF